MNELDYNLIMDRAIPLGPTPIAEHPVHVPFSLVRRPEYQLQLEREIQLEEETLP